MKKYQRGFTLIELVTVIFGLICLAGAGTAMYIVGHFIAKYW